MFFLLLIVVDYPKYYFQHEFYLDVFVVLDLLDNFVIVEHAK